MCFNATLSQCMPSPPPPVSTSSVIASIPTLVLQRWFHQCNLLDSMKSERILVSHVQLFVDPMDYSPWNSPARIPGRGISLLRDLTPITQTWEWVSTLQADCLPQSSHKSWRILEWWNTFIRRSSWPKNWTSGSHALKEEFFTNWLPEAWFHNGMCDPTSICLSLSDLHSSVISSQFIHLN